MAKRPGVSTTSRILAYSQPEQLYRSLPVIASFFCEKINVFQQNANENFFQVRFSCKMLVLSEKSMVLGVTVST